MMPSVLCLIIGHWAQDSMIHESHINGLERNFIVYKSEPEMWAMVLKSFTFEGQTVAVFVDGEDAGKYCIMNT